MISVIADDFTGAAEIGGIALSHGYTVAIETKAVRNLDTDILVIATDLRSQNTEEAAQLSALITEQLLAFHPDFIYKKIDSVLRGNIALELEAQMRVSGKSSALVIPANPALRRTIKNGIYYIGDSPLTESKFAKDPAFKAISSNVVDIIQKEGTTKVSCISLEDELPESGLLFGNTSSESDIDLWAQKVNSQMIPAGAARFFDAILEMRNGKTGGYDDTAYQHSKTLLYVCGSNFPSSRQAVLSAREKGHKVSCMPDDLYYDRSNDPGLIDQWSDDIIRSYRSNNQVIVSVLQEPTVHRIRGKQIKKIIGVLVKKVLEKTSIDELLIEGGSTAHAIVKELDYDTFFPIQSLAPGVTRMRVGNKKDLCITMKPGSYAWPKSIWKFDNKVNK